MTFFDDIAPAVPSRRYPDGPSSVADQVAIMTDSRLSLLPSVFEFVTEMVHGEGWTPAAADAHVHGLCDRAVCTGDHDEPTFEFVCPRCDEVLVFGSRGFETTADGFTSCDTITEPEGHDVRVRLI